jgi:hypothetical protein
MFKVCELKTNYLSLDPCANNIFSRSKKVKNRTIVGESGASIRDVS